MEIEQLGPYKIVGKLGRGGMGTVFEAIHSETGEKAAVKLLSASLAHEEGFRARFEAEIETLRKLKHPNIVRLFGFGEQEGHLFYAMEMVVGNSLEEELRQGRRFGWRDVTRIGIDTCRALRHAHDRGVIHRDIKPGNLLLPADGGGIKLSDFGIARLFGYSRLTHVGNVLGTAEYMAPEQAEGRPVDARSDLYSLGAVFFALLARRPLFRAKSLPEMLHKQRTERPEPVRKYSPDTPAELEHIIGELLEKDPERRIPNADLLARRLEAMMHALSIVSETLQADTGWFFDGKSSAGSQSSSLFAPSNEVPATLELDQSGQEQLGATSAVSPAAAEAQASGDVETGSMARVETQPPTRFIEVGEDELGYIAEEEPRPAVISLHTWVLVAILLLIGLTWWWFLQPPSADSLYGRIKNTIADGSIQSKLRAENNLREFLNRYSDDPRAKEFRGLERDIDLHKLEQEFESRLNSRLKRYESEENLQPIERAYLEALRYLRLDKELGTAKLQAIVHLYGQHGSENEPTGQCLALVRRQLEKIEQETEKYAQDQLYLLFERLDAADKLSAEDPERAKEMYRAVIVLYADKPWAEAAVGRARNALDSL